MKYLQTNKGRRSRMPTRQSNSVGKYSWATIKSDFSSRSMTSAFNSSADSALLTPSEQELSGCLRTQGKPSVGMICCTLSRCTISVFGIGMPCRDSSSAR
jgi:hypothetical protein